MKKKFVFIIFSIFVGIAGLSECRAENTFCSGEMGAVTVDNLIVTGACTLNGTIVEGHLNIEPDAMLSAIGVNIFGNFQADGAAGLKVADCRIDGHLNIKNSYGDQACRLIGTTVGGHVQLKGNQSPFQLRDNAIDGHLKAFRNSGGVNMTGNLVRGSLLCNDNDPAPTGSGNTVEGVREDQCAFLDPSMVSVPDVVGRLRPEAEDQITSVYLKMGVVDYAANDTVAAEHVIGQQPLGGVLVEEGVAVDLLISSGPPPRVEIAARPLTIQAGESSILTWASAHADNASIDPEIGSVAVNGSMLVAPTETTTYTIIVTDAHGNLDRASVTIEVMPAALEVVVTQPADGSQFIAEEITVAGYVNRSGATVYVNGVAAAMNSSEFVAEQVPLSPGANVVVALAEEGTASAVAGVTVTRLADVDLEPTRIELLPLAPDDGMPKISGVATVTVANNGNGSVSSPFEIALFEDINASGRYEKGEDPCLGELRIPEGPRAGEAVDVSVEYAGQLLFRDNRIHAVVDSDGEVEETDERNNVIATGASGIDISASMLRIDTAACPEVAELTVRLGNAGETVVPKGIRVSFYDGEPENGGMLMATVASSRALAPGCYEDLKWQSQLSFSGLRIIHAVVDDDGQGGESLDEHDETNNRVAAQTELCPLPPPDTGISAKTVDAVTGAIISGVEVMLHLAEDGNLGPLVRETTTDMQGRFAFTGLDAGDYLLVAAAAGYIENRWHITVEPGTAVKERDLALSPILEPEEMRIVLTWGERPADLEAHLTAPNPEGCRYHCYYWNREIPTARLDRDDSDGFGPETITLTNKSRGTYRYYVHDFTHLLSTADNALSASGAQVAVYLGAEEDPLTFKVPSGAGNVWHVFDMDGETGKIVRVDQLTYQSHPGRIDFPLLTSHPPKQVAYGETYTYQAAAIDPDADPLIYSLLKAPAGMTIDPLGGWVEWTPTGAQGGRREVELRVTDGRCGEDTQSYEIEVSYLPVARLEVSPCSGTNPGGEITLSWHTERADSVIIEPGIGPVPAEGSITLSAPATPVVYTLTAGNGAGQVQAMAPRAPMTSLTAQPACVSPGAGSTLTWSSPCAAACRMEPDIGDVAASGSMAVVADDNTLYTIRCENSAGFVESRASVSTDCGAETPTVEMMADPDCNWSPGDSVTLYWSASGVDTCEIDPGIGSVPLSGFLVVEPALPTTYTLTGHGSSGDLIAAVKVPKEPGAGLGATPQYLSIGETTTMAWTTTCADTCRLDHGIGEVACNGSLSVTPTELPVTYTLSAMNERQAVTRSVTLDHRIPRATFSASPSHLKPGAGAVLSWSTENATSCSISPDIGPVDLNGQLTVRPDYNTTYTLTVEGPGGIIHKSVSVLYVRPIAEIFADPEVLDEGETAILTWVCTDAEACSIDQGIGVVQPGGSVTVDPDGSTTYTITATGVGGAASDSVTVECLRPIAALSVSPQKIQLGESMTLSWSAAHAAVANITPNIGNVALNGSRTEMPEEPVTYRFTALGRGGCATAEARVDVLCPPVITLLEPDEPGDAANSMFTVLWEDADCDDNARISLYYDTDDTGQDGFPIVNGLEEDPDGRTGWYPAGDLYFWDTSQLPEGSYYVYAVIDDGLHEPAVDYSDVPVTIDHSRPPLDAVKLTAPDGDAYEYFGGHIALGDGWAAAGTGSVYDIQGTTHKSLYLFSEHGGQWPHAAKLPAEGDSVNNNFGKPQALDGDHLIVGANENSTGGSWCQTGSAYIFKREGAYWKRQAVLRPADPDVCFMGGAVDIDGDFAVAGTLGGTYLGMTYPGSVHVFRHAGSEWTETARLGASDAGPGGYFGSAVAIDGDTLIVGANSDENRGSGTPAAYIFRREGEVWFEEAKLIPEGGAFGFGVSVDIASGTAIVGTWENAAYVYRWTGEDWEEQARLTAADTADEDYFGASVALAGDYAIVGAGGNDDDGVDSGSAYIFRREDEDWIEQGKLTALDAAAGDRFGNTVAIGNGHVMVGAPFDDDLGSNSGSAYLYPTCGIDAQLDPLLVQPGKNASLSWRTILADTVTIEPGIGEVSSAGTITVSPDSTTNYTITAAGPYGSAVRTVTLDVGPQLPQALISAAPELIAAGDSSTLSWHAVDADTVTISPGIGAVAFSGSMIVTPSQTTVYAISATGPGGTTTADVTITVVALPPTATIVAEPATISAGQEAILRWITRSAESVSIDNGVGQVEAEGSLTVRPMMTTTYTITATGPGGTAVDMATVSVNSPISLEITSPLDGTVQGGPNTVVQGTMHNTAGHETGIAVNGLPAMVDDGRFAANIPLVEGENLITVSAVDVKGNSATASIVVIVEPAEKSLTIHADPNSGVPPLETILSIEASFDVAASTLSYDGPGEIEMVAFAPQQYRVRMTVEGIYLFDVEASDSQGGTYTGSIAVLVLDAATMNALLREKWEEMKTALADGEVQAALKYHREEVRTRYEAIYGAFGSDLPVLVGQMQDISPVYFEQSRAKYRIHQDHDIGGRTVTITYYVYFSMDEDGIWKIESY